MSPWSSIFRSISQLVFFLYWKMWFLTPSQIKQIFLVPDVYSKVQLKLGGGWIFFQKQQLSFLYEVKFSKLYLNYFYVILIFTSVCKGWPHENFPMWPVLGHIVILPLTLASSIYRKIQAAIYGWNQWFFLIFWDQQK